MLIMFECPDQALVNAKRPGDPIPLVTLAPTASVNCVVEIGICDVYLIRIDTDNWALTTFSSVH